MSLAPYERLLELAERETAVVGAGALEDLPQIIAERSATIAGLPAVAPPGAAPLLTRLAAMQALTSAAMAAARTEAGRELGSMGRARGAVQGYAASARQSDALSERLDGSA